MRHPLYRGILFILLIGFTTYSNEISSLDKILGEKYTPSSVGVFIKELGKDSIIVSHNIDSFYNPASVLKMITGAAALDFLGLQYCFKTRVFIDSSLNRDSGIVHGNLYIKGGGDPGFLAERLWLFVQHLKHNGIKKITEDLILDDSFFDQQINGPGFSEDYSSRAYEAPVAALSASFNTVAVHIAPGGKIGSPVIVTPFPAIKGVKIISRALTSNSGSSSQLDVQTRKVGGKTAIVVNGSFGIRARPKYIYRKVWNTWENFGWVLQGLFEENGIAFAGEVKHMVIPDSIIGSKPFYVFESRPLPEFIFNMFKYSSNFAAEMVFKTIVAEHDSVPASWENGARMISNWWQEKKVFEFVKAYGDSLQPQVTNGSGMGGGNKVTPAQIAGLLEYVWQQKVYAPEYISSLSIAGVDGTLETRFTKSPLKGFIRAKTGTLNSRGVSNLAGYVLLPGKTFIFVILVNNKMNSQYSHWVLQRQILEKFIHLSRAKKTNNN